MAHRKLVEEKAGGSARVPESWAGRGQKEDEGWSIAGDSEAGSKVGQVHGDGEGLRAGHQEGKGVADRGTHRGRCDHAARSVRRNGPSCRGR